jgi:single-stranded-DNA-specific exonuclease
VELLLTQDPARARVLAAQIEGLNAQRRLLTSQVYEAAESLLKKNPKWLLEPGIVLSQPNWPGGVVGIVANRLVDRYHKPAILLTESEDGMVRGSARSVEGLHITHAIAAQQENLLGFGGHPMAAGLSLTKDKLSAFRKGFFKAVEKQLGSGMREEPTLQIDAWLDLKEIHIDLANALESLAPFGAGNPSLMFATRHVKMKSTTTLGRTKEHLKLWVEDETGNVRDILWWGGAGEELPEEGSVFDIAYSLRSSSFRGEKQVTLQFEEFRVTQEAPVELRKREIEIRDWRLQTHPVEELPEGTLVWAEAGDRSKGRGRYDLQESEQFAMYTTPPSSQVLRAVLETVKPRTVYVFAASPQEQSIEEFLNRLAGLAKYAINQRAGKLTVHELAVVTSGRERAVEIGLEWLAAGGHVSMLREEDAYILSKGSGLANQYLQKELYTAVKGILNETAAYRAHFRRADLKSLLGEFS